MELHISGPFLGGVWETLLAHLSSHYAFGPRLLITPKPSPGFLLDKNIYLAAPTASTPPGLLEALDLGMVSMVKNAPGMAHLSAFVNFWWTGSDLVGLLNSGRPLEVARRKELRATHEAAQVARRWLEILAGP